MFRKIVSIVLIILGLATGAEAAFYFLQYSRTQKVIEKGLFGYDTEESKSLIAKTSGYDSYDSMVKREKMHFYIAFAIAILMSGSGIALLVFNPRIKNDLQFDYLYDECESFDNNPPKRWRF